MTRTACEPVDLLVAGAGLAGIYAAIEAAALGARVALVTKGSLRASNSFFAQGGTAVDRNLRSPYTEQANLEIDRSLGGGLTLSVGYLFVAGHKLVRPIDIPVQICNTEKCRKLTGWKPEIPYETTLRDLLDYWRERLSTEGNRFLTR